VRYWLNTVSRDHVRIGEAGGFTRAQHGSPAALRRLQRGDLVVFYSPKTTLENGEPVQAFVAAGEVVDDAPFQVEMSPGFHPWRRRLRFLTCREAPIAPLIEGLSFIRDKRRWGYPFRRGLFEIPESDFRLIGQAMQLQP
jgi:predicted RNA-binding protein